MARLVSIQGALPGFAGAADRQPADCSAAPAQGLRPVSGKMLVAADNRRAAAEAFHGYSPRIAIALALSLLAGTVMAGTLTALQAMERQHVERQV